MSKAKPGAGGRATRGAFWVAIATLSEQLVAMASLVVLARLLGPADFGLVALATTLAGVAKLFSEGALGQALVRQRDATSAHVTAAYVASLALSAAAALLLVVFAWPIAGFFEAPSLRPMIFLVAATLPLAALGAITQSVLQKQGRFRTASLSNIPGIAIGNLLVAIGLARAGYGAWAVLWGLFVQHGLTMLLRLAAARPIIDMRWPAGELRQLLNYGTIQTFVRWLNFLARSGDNFIVGKMLGLEALGLYSRAYRLMTIAVEVFSRSIDQVLFPVMSGIQNDPERFRRGFCTSLRLSLLILAALTMACVFACGPAVELVLGREWMGCVPAAQILFGSMAFRIAYKQVNIPNLVHSGPTALVTPNLIYLGGVVGGSVAACLYGRTIEWVAVAVYVTIVSFYLVSAAKAKRVLDMGWREFGALHLPGAVIALATTAALVALQSVEIPGPPIIELAVIGLASGATAAACILALPRFFLGDDIRKGSAKLLGRLPAGAVLGRIIAR